MLSLLDFLVPFDPFIPLELVGISFVSRAGNEFHTLANLKEQLGHIARFPALREWLSRDPVIIGEREDGVVKRLVLDGEVCVMRPMAKMTDVEGKSQPSTSGTSGVASLWDDQEHLIEDFSATVSAIRTAGTIAHPRYFVFDTLSWAEVEAKSEVRLPGLGKAFGQRLIESGELVRFLDSELEKEGAKEKMTRALVHSEIVDKDQVEEMVQRAAEEGWEGLIFRASKPYKGSRTYVLPPPVLTTC